MNGKKKVFYINLNFAPKQGKNKANEVQILHDILL